MEQHVSRAGAEERRMADSGPPAVVPAATDDETGVALLRGWCCYEGATMTGLPPG